MNELAEDFANKRYVHLQSFLTADTCQQLLESMKKEIAEHGHTDEDCPLSKSLTNSAMLDNVLVDLLPSMEEATGLKLLPTYAYARWYLPGEELKIHKDRPACEISATITLGFQGNNWPIYIGYHSDEKTDVVRIDPDGNECHSKDVRKIEMDAGDAVIYHGCELYHWRDKYVEGEWQAQIFLHYVDANGPNTEWAYNNTNRSEPVAKFDDLNYWMYTDVLTPQDCDNIIQFYSQAEKEIATVETRKGESLDTSIRNVEKIILPTYKGIGAILAATGIDANQQRWNFDVVRANQCEFLTYPAGGGRYKSHIDTILDKSEFHMKECRKLTVLAFLNDNFTGGKFYLQNGSERFYPPQKQGTIFVFPSFLLHGVEDVIEGTRYTAVCWLVGPWFK